MQENLDMQQDECCICRRIWICNKMSAAFAGESGYATSTRGQRSQGAARLVGRYRKACLKNVDTRNPHAKFGGRGGVNAFGAVCNTQELECTFESIHTSLLCQMNTLCKAKMRLCTFLQSACQVLHKWSDPQEHKTCQLKLMCSPTL